MKRLEEPAGFTLVEMLVTIVLTLILFGGVLSVLDVFSRDNVSAQLRNETQDLARTAIDQLSRDLRSAASPTPTTAGALEKANPDDMVFQTVDPNTTYGGSNATNQIRVRYCLDASKPSNETLWRQTQTWTSASAPAIPSTTSCPSSAWPTQYRLVSNVTNLVDAQNPRPLFTYAPLSETSTAQIDGVIVDLFADERPGTRSVETELRSGIFLRNSNAPPIATFTVSQQGNHQVALNASLSTDPNGQALTYQWSLDGSAISGATNQQYTTGTLTAGSTHTFGLTVTDTTGLSNSTSQAVTIQ